MLQDMLCLGSNFGCFNGHDQPYATKTPTIAWTIGGTRQPPSARTGGSANEGTQHQFPGEWVMDPPVRRAWAEMRVESAVIIALSQNP